jgi:hypothetical protein
MLIDSGIDLEAEALPAFENGFWSSLKMTLALI